MFLQGAYVPAELDALPNERGLAPWACPAERTCGIHQAISDELVPIGRLAASAFDASAAAICVMVDGLTGIAATTGIAVDRATVLRHLAPLGDTVTVNLDAAPKDRSDAADRDTQPVFRFCATAPLLAPDGTRVGALCVFDEAPRAAVSDRQRGMLRQLADLSMAILVRAARSAPAPRDGAGLFQASPKPMWVYDLSSLAFLEVNEAAVELYGYSREAFLGMTVMDIRPPEERERFAASVRDRSDLDESAIWRHRKADGTDFDVITSGREICFGGRKAVVVVALDRTEVHALRNTLGSTQLLLDTIIEALPTGVFVKDMQDSGKYLIYNPTLADIVGRHAGDIIGRSDHDIFDSLEGGEFVTQDRSVMASGRHLVIEEEPVTRASGEVRWVRTVKKPLPTMDGSAPRYLLGISEDITERRQAEDRLAHMALHDALTDLPNRTCFQQYLDRALQRQPSRDVVLLYVDLDFFKTINDTYGHHVGDGLLKDAAARLKSCLRPPDMVARLGGDEFAIVTRMRGNATATDVAGRLLQCFDLPFDLGSCRAHVGASIGIAVSRGCSQTADVLMRHADIALYAAKADGRGLAKIYADGMSGHVEARHALSEDLRSAIAEQQLELDYQPLYCVATDRITGFEALLRWRHPVKGRIAPGKFIAIAEQTGLIVPIGEWVLMEACRQAATWPSSIRVAVNLSAVQFKKAGLVATIERALADSCLAPERLELEITESILLAESGANIQLLHSLRALGVRIAIDDFGTGYSSLSYLRSFPFDKIKIDRSFISDVCENTGSLAIVRAVTGLGSSLSIITTAEGIETPEQFAKLKAEGFDELQGYLIGRPMPPDEARTMANCQASGGHSALALKRAGDHSFDTGRP